MFLRTSLALVAALPLTACQAWAVDETCSPVTLEGSHFTICRAKPSVHRIRLVDKGSDGAPLRRLNVAAASVDPTRKHVAFAMNAGMFDSHGLPIGLYVERGVQAKTLNRRDGGGNFHLKPNGVFYGDASGWHVATTDNFAAHRPARLDFATQSGPMLVIGGDLHPAFSPNGESLQLRNGVGVDARGAAWFAISDEAVSFGRFARLFRDRLGCRNALYLDGAVSQLLDTATGRRDDGAPLGPIVVVLTATTASP